jgi:hypothetical protein
LELVAMGELLVQTMVLQAVTQVLVRFVARAGQPPGDRQPLAAAQRVRTQNATVAKRKSPTALMYYGTQSRRGKKPSSRNAWRQSHSGSHDAISLNLMLSKLEPLLPT